MNQSFTIESDANEKLGEFSTLSAAQNHARKIKLTGYIFSGVGINAEYWRYYLGRCNDSPRGRDNRKENFK